MGARFRRHSFPFRFLFATSGWFYRAAAAWIACVEINAAADLRGAHFPLWNWCALRRRDESRKYCKSRRCDLRTTTSHCLINRRTIINERTQASRDGEGGILFSKYFPIHRLSMALGNIWTFVIKHFHECVTCIARNFFKWSKERGRIKKKK